MSEEKAEFMRAVEKVLELKRLLIRAEVALSNLRVYLPDDDLLKTIREALR